MWKAILASLITAVPLCPALGEAQNFGHGLATCAQFAEDYKASPQLNETLYFTWAQGFMSGLNVASIREHATFRDVSGASIDSLKSSFRTYCDQHPLRLYEEAVFTAYQALPLRAARP
jgi:hypothetical protein